MGSRCEEDELAQAVSWWWGEGGEVVKRDTYAGLVGVGEVGHIGW